MSRQLGSLHRSNSHPANLQTPIPIIPLFAFPPPDFPISNISSSTNSDTDSDISVLCSISQFNNSNVETPDEFADSEPSPSNYTQTNSSVFSKPPFQPIPSNHPLPSIEITLPSFPQYTLNTPNDTNDTRNFVDEHVLMTTLHWTAYYNFTNPLCLPLANTHDSIGKNKNMLYRLTTTLTPRQFTYVGYKKLLKTFTAPRANEFAIEYYDHNIIRPNQDQFLNEDRFANPQLTEKIFIKTSYVFTLNIFDRKNDHIISESHMIEDPSIAQIPTQPTSKLQSQSYHFLLSHHPIFRLVIYHQARILILILIFQFYVLSHNLITLM